RRGAGGFRAGRRRVGDARTRARRGGGVLHRAGHAGGRVRPRGERGVMRSYALLLRWQYLRLRREIVMIVLIQVALALGVVYGLSFLLPNIDRSSALFLATGAPTLTLLILGLTVVPQEVSQGKLTGRSAYLMALPVPRLA